MKYSDELQEYCRNSFKKSSQYLNKKSFMNSEDFTDLWKDFKLPDNSKEDEKKGGNKNPDKIFRPDEALEFLHTLFFHMNFPVDNMTASEPLYIKCFKEIFPFDFKEYLSKEYLSKGHDEKIVTLDKLKKIFKSYLKIELLDTPGGAVPVIKTHHRDDFEYLVRALALKNRNKSIPLSMGAAMIKGLKSIHKTRMPVIHRVILISNGPYSNVQAQSLGIDPSVWPDLSIKIRTAHEAAHYVTQRLFNHSTNNVHDELIADYFGITHALGKYESDWFMTFAGVDSKGNFKNGGRLKNYKKPFELSEKAFQELCAIIPDITDNIQKFDRSIRKEYPVSLFGKHGLETISVLCSLSPLEIAEPKSHILMKEKFVSLVKSGFDQV